MENINEPSIFNLTLSQKLKDDFKTIAIWAIISSVIAFISAAVGMMNNISKGALFSAIITAAISVFLNIYLFNFGKKMRAAITDDNQEQVSESLNDLRIYFKIYGILVIIVLAVVLIAILFFIFTTTLR